MKKIVTLILLVLLGYNSIGYYIIYHIQQLIAQKEITEYINSGVLIEEQLTLFKLPVQEYYERSSKDFNRVAGDFEYNGKFYERVREKLENDTMYIYCLNDEKQEALLKQLAEHVEMHLLDKEPNKKNRSQKIFKDLLKEYLPKSSTVLSFKMQLISIQKFKISNNLFSPSIYLNIPTPPPKVV